MLSDKTLDKIQKTLGLEVIAEMNELNPDALKSQIVIAETAMKDARQQLEANLIYQQTKEILKDVSQSLKDVKKFQNAKIAYALDLLESKGQ